MATATWGPHRLAAETAPSTTSLRSGTCDRTCDIAIDTEDLGYLSTPTYRFLPIEGTDESPGARQLFARLYVDMSHEKALRTLFWCNPGISYEEYRQEMRNALWLVAFIDTYLAGCIWVKKLQAHQAGEVAVWYSKRVPPDPRDRLTQIPIRWAFKRLKLQQLWAHTPWLGAVRHWERAGGYIWSLYPEYCRIGSNLKTLYTLRMTSHDWKDRYGNS